MINISRFWRDFVTSYQLQIGTKGTFFSKSTTSLPSYRFENSLHTNQRFQRSIFLFPEQISIAPKPDMYKTFYSDNSR